MNLAREPEMGADVYHAPAVQCYIKITMFVNCFTIIDRLMVAFIVLLMCVLHEMQRFIFMVSTKNERLKRSFEEQRLCDFFYFNFKTYPSF